MKSHPILTVIAAVVAVLLSASAFGAIQAGMTTEEMIADIVAGMESGSSCEQTKAAITKAVELDNDAASAIVSALAARKDTGCYDDAWPAQRVEDRIGAPSNGATLYAEEACTGAYSVVQAAVAGLGENSTYADAATDADRQSITASLGEKVVKIVEAANMALSGDTAPGNICSQEIVVAAATGVGDQALRESVWAALGDAFNSEGPSTWEAESYAFVTTYQPDIHMMLRSLKTASNYGCIGVGCDDSNGGDSSDEEASGY